MILLDPDNKEIVALKCLPKLFNLQKIPTEDVENHFIVFVEVSALPFLVNCYKLLYFLCNCNC